ncbi:hypothetical protein L611_000500000420 [Aminobacter sp. J15]|nr:hypothetical protein L611_000500000420 [Aminobacter sp. J15]
MAPDRPHLAQPGAVARHRVAQLLLDAGMHQHALDIRVARRALEQRRMRRRPLAVVDIERVLLEQRDEIHLLALLVREAPVRHRQEPDVRIEAELMGSMAGGHRSATRLRNVAQEQSGPAILDRIAREALQQCDHLRMAPAPVARKAHRLPGRAIGSNRDAALEAALGIGAVHRWFGRGRQAHRAEHILGERIGLCRNGEGKRGQGKGS